jgi:predicted phage replisome organizer|nr:MAG TPA: Replication initiation and membrane attachment [Caudoviricetes sp.]
MSERESAKFYWLQLREEFFESDEIDWLEEQPNGPAQVLFYLKLCLKSLKTDGLLVRKVGQMLIPYDAEKLAVFTKTDVNTVQCAIVNLKMCGLVEVLEDGTLFLSHLTNLIGSQSVGAMKRQQQRARQKEAKNVSLTNTRQVDDKCRDKCPPEYRDKRLETRREDMGGNSAPLDDYDLIADEVGSEFDVVEPPPEPPACNEEKDQGSRMPPCPYDRIVTLYHEILPELPRVATLTSKRRSWITARWRSVCTTEKVASQADGLDLFRGYFSLVRKSPFLMGLKQPGKGHSRTFKADLEWLMNESNFTKVVEGKYA